MQAPGGCRGHPGQAKTQAVRQPHAGHVAALPELGGRLCQEMGTQAPSDPGEPRLLASRELGPFSCSKTFVMKELGN